MVSFYYKQAILLGKTKWGRQERRGRRREGGGGRGGRGREEAERGETNFLVI